MKLTYCPYCGKKISYLSAYFIRSKGEYFCNKCKKESNILIKKSLLIPFISSVIIAALILAIFMLFTDRENLWFVFFIAVPFLVFYAVTPFFVVLRPKKKHMDSLYDTQIVESPIVDPDPTMAKTSRVVPAFSDNDVFSDDFKPVINSEIFNAIKEERKNIADNSGDTKSFDKFENISSSNVTDATMPVGNIKEISKIAAKQNKTDINVHKYNVSKNEDDDSYNLTLFE